MSDEVKAYFCPQCNSVRVGYVFKIGNLFGVMPRMQCKDCGFSSVSFPVLVSRKKECKKVVRKKVVRKKAKKKIVKKVVRRKRR